MGYRKVTAANVCYGWKADIPMHGFLRWKRFKQVIGKPRQVEVHPEGIKPAADYHQ